MQQSVGAFDGGIQTVLYGPVTKKVEGLDPPTVQQESSVTRIVPGPKGRRFDAGVARQTPGHLSAPRVALSLQQVTKGDDDLLRIRSNNVSARQ